MWILDLLLKRKLAPKLIEIDDSGSGSLYGGIVILVTDGINNFHKEVALKHFAIKDKLQRNKKIPAEIFNIIKRGLKSLKADKKSTIISICQGSTFNYSQAQLEKLGYKIKRGKIEGRTNDEAERLFNELLEKKYGITDYSPKDYKKENLRQFELLRRRRDFKNVKQNINGVEQIIRQKS